VVFTVTCRKVPVTDLRFNRDSLALSVGDTGILIVTVLPEDATYKKLSWSSSNSAVAIIKDGMILALNEGTATISIATSDGNKTASCALTVNKKVEGEPEMIIVKGGTLPMGCTDNDCWDDGREEPLHQVTLSSFRISKYPITQKQWRSIMGSNHSHYEGDNLPVVQVNWAEVQEFISKLNDVTGKDYRLPTEAEWEFAARGGTKCKGYKFSGSNDIDAVAWYRHNSGRVLRPVGTKMPNELGIYDMSGNVWEWCNDWYGPYTRGAKVDPQGLEQGSIRVGRGGGGTTDTVSCRVSTRTELHPNFRGPYVGFRVAISI